MLKIAICDDNATQLEILQELLYDYDTVSLYKVEVESFTDGESLLKAIKENGSYDIYILDVVMPEINGLELAKKIREKDELGKIVFLSSETSFVFKAFSVSASGYLVKPVNPEDLFDLIDTLRSKIEKEQPSFIQIQTDSGTRRIEVKDILFVDTVDRAPIYHMIDGSEIVGKSRRCRFQELVEDLIRGHSFVLSSVGVAVNLANVEAAKAESNEILMKDGTVLLCSRTMKEHFIQRLKHYWNT